MKLIFNFIWDTLSNVLEQGNNNLKHILKRSSFSIIQSSVIFVISHICHNYIFFFDVHIFLCFKFYLMIQNIGTFFSYVTIGHLQTKIFVHMCLSIAVSIAISMSIENKGGKVKTPYYLPLMYNKKFYHA